LFERLFRNRSRDGSAPRQARPSRHPEGGQLDEGLLGKLRNVTLVSQRRLTAGITGEHPSPRRSNALEFADYRNYAPGDDLRRVDWNAYLRLGQLIVKLADAPERVALHILLDTSGSMAWGHPDKFSYARGLAAALAYVALSHMDSPSLLVLRDQECTRWSRQSSSSPAAMVRDISSLRPGGSTNLDAALAAFSTLGIQRGVAVLISDLLSPSGYQSGLERLSRMPLRPVVIQLLSPEELNPPLEGDVELVDSETGDAVQVSIDRAVLRRYRRRLQEWLEGIEVFCSRRGITYLRVETTQSMERLLLERLRREKVLR